MISRTLISTLSRTKISTSINLLLTIDTNRNLIQHYEDSGSCFFPSIRCEADRSRWSSLTSSIPITHSPHYFTVDKTHQIKLCYEHLVPRNYGAFLWPSQTPCKETTEVEPTEMKGCSSVLKKRRKKINKHQYRKWRKKTRFMRRAIAALKKKKQ